MKLDSSEMLELKRDGHVLYLTLNNPERLNAFVGPMLEQFSELIRTIGREDDIHVIVLSGAGKTFSAGGDINSMQRDLANMGAPYPKLPSMKRLITDLLDVPQILISKINGAAIGLGATIALLADISFAANHAKIADPHVKVGYVAGDGGSAIWPQLIGYARAKQFLLTGDALTGEEAAKLGLVNFSYPAEELDAAVQAFTQKILDTPWRAVQWTKATINIGLKQSVAAVIDAGAAYQALSHGTRDHAEAVNAFIEKRAAKLSGN